MNVTKNLRVKFLFVGIINTVFGFAIFTTLYLLLREFIDYIAIFVACQAVAVTFSHATQRRFVWKSSESYLWELLKFGSAYLGISIANLLLLYAAVDIYHCPVIISQYLIGASLVLVSYCVQSRFVFNLKRTKADPF